MNPLSAPFVMTVMPWASVAQPSIQAGVLTSRLQRDGIEARSLYANLEFARRTGTTLYEAYGGFHNLCADWAFSHALFGEHTDDDGFIAFASQHGVSVEQSRELRGIRGVVPGFLEWCVNAVDWNAVRVVGFTTTMLQGVPALATARLLKERFPHLFILFGGAGCQGVMGQTMFASFDFIDGLVEWEADELIVPVVRAVLDGGDPPALEGMHWRCHTPHHASSSVKPVALDDYPLPNYDDYFEQVAQMPYASAVTPLIPFEASRGCWWAVRRQCTFCGLNGELVAQRVRDVGAVVDDLVALHARHGISRFFATDNILAPPHVKALPELLQRHLPGTRIFFEVRAAMTRTAMENLAQAGVVHLQVGIESLTSEVLEMVDKGTQPILNICFLRRATELGVRAYWNLLYGFPGEKQEWYEPMLAMLPALYHLPAPDVVQFSLQRFSPYFDAPERFGIRVKGPLPGTRYVWKLADEQIMNLSYSLDFEVPGQPDPKGLGVRLRAAVAKWASSKAALTAVLLDDERILIEDSRPLAAQRLYFLSVAAGRILRALEQPRTTRQLLRFLVSCAPGVYLEHGGRAGYLATLDFLRARDLIYTEADRHLALVVPRNAAFWLGLDESRGVAHTQPRPASVTHI